jgi:choline transport protein
MNRLRTGEKCLTLPLTEFQVHPKLKVPLNALLLISFINFILSLINIGSSVAYNAIISLCTLGIMASYILPISFFLLKKLNGTSIEYGPFRLGRWGIPINAIAICFATFEVIWTPWPPMPDVTAETMNYAGPVFIVIIIGSLADWLFSGRKRFNLPVPQRVPMFHL